MLQGYLTAGSLNSRSGTYGFLAQAQLFTHPPTSDLCMCSKFIIETRFHHFFSISGVGWVSSLKHKCQGSTTILHPGLSIHETIFGSHTIFCSEPFLGSQKTKPCLYVGNMEKMSMELPFCEPSVHISSDSISDALQCWERSGEKGFAVLRVVLKLFDMRRTNLFQIACSYSSWWNHKVISIFPRFLCQPALCPRDTIIESWEMLYC